MICTVPATVYALKARSAAPVLAKPLARLPLVGLATMDAEIVIVYLIWSLMLYSMSEIKCHQIT